MSLQEIDRQRLRVDEERDCFTVSQLNVMFWKTPISASNAHVEYLSYICVSIKCQDVVFR